MQILVNGEAGKEILCKRRFRQRDPLSPLLFVLVVDGLNRMLSNMAKSGMIESLSSSSSEKFINLQYVDDTLIFGNCDLR